MKAKIALAKTITLGFDKSIERPKTDKDRLRDAELHPSSFPYCFLKHYFGLLVSREDAEEVSSAATASGTTSTEFGLDFYGGVGTAAHLTFQRYFSLSGKILGDWACGHCKKKVKLSTDCTCPKCGEIMEYEEVGIKFGLRLVGHIDGIYLVKWGSAKTGHRYYVIDYKTTSLRALDKYRNAVKLGIDPPFPYINNKYQIESYTALFQHQYKLPVSGWMLIYIARDNPREFEIVGEEITAEDKREFFKRVKLWDTQFDTVVTAKSVQPIVAMLDQKLCPDKKWYRDNLEKKMPCPLARYCFDRPTLIHHIKSGGKDQKWIDV